jgi:hypothetical protein
MQTKVEYPGRKPANSLLERACRRRMHDLHGEISGEAGKNAGNCMKDGESGTFGKIRQEGPE